MIQKSSAMGNWWLAASSWQRACSCVVSCAEYFLWNIKSPKWLSPPIAQIWCPATSGFSQNKITFERKEISDHQWDSGKYKGAADGNWESCMMSQGVYFEEDWGIIALCTMFLVSWIFFNTFFYFSYYMAGYLLDRPHILFHCERVFWSVKGLIKLG